MAWHSKRHNIKHRKAIQDSKKSQVYAKVGKIVQMAARNGDNPMLNPALAVALQKARQAGLPRDVIQRAVEKWSGKLEGEELVEIYYEWYGPGGIALYIKCLTTNTKRTGSFIRALLTKHGGNLWEPGSVAWQFIEKGELYIDGTVTEATVKGNVVQTVLPLDEARFEEAVLETTALDYSFEEGSGCVITTKEDFIGTLRYFEEHKRHIEEAELQFMPENTIILDAATEEKLQNIIELLEDDDDVDTVFHNAG